MKAKVFFISLMILSLLLILPSCKKEEINNRKTPVLNIVDAESLVALEILPQKVSSSNFYKITVDGNLEEVKFVNPDGSDLGEDQATTSIEVDHIYNVNKDYLVLSGNFSIIDTNEVLQGYNALLVSKNDGAIFDFGDFNPFFNKFDEDVFQSDNYGNIYYPVSAEGYEDVTVNKIDVSDPYSLMKSMYLPTGQTTTIFGISQAGDCIYGGYRLRKASGGIVDITVEGEEIMGFWIGNVGDIFISSSYSVDDGSNTYYGIRISALSPTNNFEEPIGFWGGESQGHFWGDSPGEYSQHYIVRKTSSTVFVGMNPESKSWEFNESTGLVTGINMPDYNGKHVSSICYSDNYYYIANGTSLFKVSLSDHSFENLFISDQYDVYSMGVSSDDILQFSGIRFSDGKKVFCEISPSGTITTIDEEMDREATALFRLN